jgi:uncharacterized protein YjbI with pentapeptide repeats
LLVFTIATFPGEWLETNLPSLQLVPTKWPSLESDKTQGNQASQSEAASGESGSGSDGAVEGQKEPQSFLALPREERWRKVTDLLESMRWSSLHELLVAGDVDLVARKPTSLWSNVLVLPGIDVVDHAKFDSDEKIAAFPVTLSLRGRRLEGAVLIDAALRRVDLTAAQLQGATLDRVDLRNAKFGCADRKSKVSGAASHTKNFVVLLRDYLEAQKLCTQLQDASLLEAQLQGTSLESAELQRTILTGAHLQGVSLKYAQLQGARLDGAQLQGALLVDAELQGASLEGAQLQSALLYDAQLQAATLTKAQLQGALLDGAQLQGARLDGAVLLGALLS